MAFFSDQLKQEVRDRIRLEDLVRDYNVFLQPAGGHRLRALCPFHAEKTPSFYVNVEGQFFHCFGCKAAGDIFTFLQKTESVTFPEALEMLAQRAGVDMERHRSRGPGSGSRPGLKKGLYDALTFAEEYYHRLLLDDPRAEPARRYLLSRALSRESWERFRLGYSLPEWDAFLRHALRRGLKREVLEQAGLIRENPADRRRENSHHDYFRGRILFPIADGQKRVLGFGARTLGDDRPKYLNTPRTPVFDKSQVLYGLPQARAAVQREGRIAIVEGYTDTIAAHQAGLEHFVASLGTAFTVENARRLKRLAPRVDLLFDGDFAGQSAAERSLSLLVGEDLDVRIYGLSGGRDPCDAILEMGGAAFRARMEEEAQGVFEFKWRRSVGAPGGEERGAGDTARALDEVLDLLLRVPNVVARKLYIREFSEKLGVPAPDIEKRLKRRSSVATPRGPVRSGIPDTAPEGPARRSLHPGTAPATGAGRAASPASDVDNPTLEEVVLECLLAEPDRAARRWEELPGGFFVTPPMKSISRAVASQLHSTGLDVERLVRFLDDPDATPTLARVLGRVESQQLFGSRGVYDTDEIWARCLRDIGRRALLRRRRELEEVKSRARAAGDAAALLEAEREYREVLKKIAR